MIGGEVLITDHQQMIPEKTFPFIRGREVRYVTHVQTKKGFTLIELLVVIAIIAILSAIGLVALNGAREKARDAQRRSDIAQIRTALSLYYDDNGSTYPSEQSEGASEAVATDNVPDQSMDSTKVAGTATVDGVLTDGGALTAVYLAQALFSPSADGSDHDHYFYVTNVATTAASPVVAATSYIVFTQLEAAGGSNYYGINEQGSVTDTAELATARPTCDNTASPVCQF